MKNWKPWLAAGLLSLSAAAQAAGYPERPLHLLVGFPAGGASDVAARAMAAKMETLLGQPVVVENKPGPASNIASDAVAQASHTASPILSAPIPCYTHAACTKRQPPAPAAPRTRDLTA